MITEFEIDCTDGFDMEDFQNLDTSEDWKDHDPSFEWTEEELWDMRLEEQHERQEMEAMAGWWDMEGVRCSTFGRNPNKNPYRGLINEP